MTSFFRVYEKLRFISYCREVLVDLVGNPGCLCEPDSLINGPSSISIFSPLHFPRFRHINSTVDFESLARQYFIDCESLNLVFEDPPTGKFLRNILSSIIFFNEKPTILLKHKRTRDTNPEQFCKLQKQKRNETTPEHKLPNQVKARKNPKERLSHTNCNN